VQLGEHHLRGRQPVAAWQIHHVHGNAAAVVHNGDGVVHMDDDVDLRGVARQSLIHRVIDNFVDQVMQPHFAGRADVHGWAQAYRFQSFENLDVLAGVAIVVAVLHGGAAHNISRHRIPFARCAKSRVTGEVFRTLESEYRVSRVAEHRNRVAK
jgi:hypothetical protein